MDNQVVISSSKKVLLAVSFLSDIPLNLKEACEKCKSKSIPEASCPASCIQQSVSAHGDQSNIFLTINQPTAKSSYAYQRSASTAVDFSVRKTVVKQRQFSLTEVAPFRHPQSAGDGYATMKSRLHSPVMKIKFVTENMLQSNRIFLVEPSHKTPCSVYSVLRYTKESHKSKSANTTDGIKHIPAKVLEYQTVPGSLTTGNFLSSSQVVSYHFLLEPSQHEPDVELDCAEWLSGKHRIVLALDSYRVSVVGYTKPSELKRDLNVQFKNSYPSVNITLSKLRSLERQMQRTAKTFGLQTGVLTCAKVYFERLVFSSLVNKTNRQQVAATCFLLSAKIHGDLKSQEVTQLVSALEHAFKSNKSSFISLEFPVFAALKFSLLPKPGSRIRNISGEISA